MKIREYRHEDKAQVIKLFEGLQDYERTLNPLREKGNKVSVQYLDEVLKEITEKVGAIYVAVDEDVVGFIALWITTDHDPKINIFDTYGYIPDLFVLEEYRGEGIGSKLIQKAEAFFRANGVKYVKIEVLDNNEAKGLYMRKDYKVFETLLIKDIST